MSDCIRHLGFLLRGHGRDGLMAILTAYFDKSGDVGREIVIVAGFIATDSRWERLGRAWERVMARARVSDFHMAEFMRDAEDSRFNAREWPRPRKNLLASKLLRIIAEYVQKPVVVAVTMKAFREAAIADSKRYVGDPYRLCSAICLIASSEWARESRRRERVDFVFDNDGKFFSETTKAYDVARREQATSAKCRIGNIAFASRIGTPGIQAADMFAHLIYEYQKRHLINSGCLPHPYLDGLLQSLGKRNKAVIERFYEKPEGVEFWGNTFKRSLGAIPRAAFKGHNPHRRVSA
jgi:hypothetical protein